MKTYAHIRNGQVVELIQLADGVDPTTLFNPAVTVIDVTTLAPQPAVGWTYSNGVFAAPPAAVAATQTQAARAAKAAGCQIASVSMPALNATYTIGDIPLGKMAVTAQLIVMLGNAFPPGVASIAVKDAGGAVRTVTTPAAYVGLYQALAGYALALEQVSIANAGALPPQPVNIA